MDALPKIGRYEGRLLQSHGTADEIIPFELGERLFQAATCEKQFVRIDGALHNDPQSPAYYEAMERLFAALAAEAHDAKGG